MHCWDMLASVSNDAVCSQDGKLLRRAGTKDAAGGGTAQVPDRREKRAVGGAADDSGRRDVPSVVRFIQILWKQIEESSWVGLCMRMSSAKQKQPCISAGTWQQK